VETPPPASQHPELLVPPPAPTQSFASEQTLPGAQSSLDPHCVTHAPASHAKGRHELTVPSGSILLTPSSPQRADLLVHLPPTQSYPATHWLLVVQAVMHPFPEASQM
jgi:hypothetical protein